ncbi:MAG: hypothetical protein ACK4NA_09565 [Alphaproteobacteria bacterium]
MPQWMSQWIERTLVDLARQMRWSFLPPLMVYVAAGVSGLTAIVGTFFVKDYLGLSAAFLAALGFWVGIPWALKMPIGHLVDLIWRWKAMLVYFGAGLIAASLGIMYLLIVHRAAMVAIAPAEAWFVASTLLAPVGYVVQDVVADAMTVEAVPRHDEAGSPYSALRIREMHTTMQTLGRFAIISGSVFVAVLNIFMFSGIETMSEADKIGVYADIYLVALAIPAISVSGTALAAAQRRQRLTVLRQNGLDETEIARIIAPPVEIAAPNWWILGGGLAFVFFTVSLGLSSVPHAQEIIFVGSLVIVVFLMSRLIRELAPDVRRALVGTAIIIFAFRAVPLPGAGLGWFEIDVLGFDQRFFSVLSLIASLLALIGLILLRPLMAARSIAYIVVLLTVAGAILSLPNIGLYYGVQHWTAAMSGGVVDARFIAVINTALESPLGQIAMIPMLAWIANNAPAHLKATFFAVMASFTNLALSASSLGTKYLNQIFLVTREVRDPATGALQLAADYGELGWLLFTVLGVGLALPLAAVALVQASRLRTRQ